MLIGDINDRWWLSVLMEDCLRT